MCLASGCSRGCTMAKRNEEDSLRKRAKASSPINIERPKSSSPSFKYASGKWSEPPSPSSLPAPPQHWMQAKQLLIGSVKQPEQDFAKQLKVLLKVQA